MGLPSNQDWYRDLHVLIGIPSGATWQAQTAMDVALLANYFEQEPVFKESKTQKLTITNSRGSMLPQLRENLVKTAMEQGATHLLFIDSDMTFPR